MNKEQASHTPPAEEDRGVESEVAKLIWSTLTDTDFSVIQRQDMVNAHPAMVAVRCRLSSPRVEGETRRLREALETIQSAYRDQDLNHRDFRVLAGTTAAEALEGEKDG